MSDARTRLERADHGVLSTLHPTRGIDSVPVCFVVAGDVVGIPIDTVKPKRSTRLGSPAQPRGRSPRDAARRALGRGRLERRSGGCGRHCCAPRSTPTSSLSSPQCSPRSTRSTQNGGIDVGHRPAASSTLTSWDARATTRVPRLGPMKRAIALTLVAVAASTFLFAACGDDSDSVSGDVEQLCSDVVGAELHGAGHRRSGHRPEDDLGDAGEEHARRDPVAGRGDHELRSPSSSDQVKSDLAERLRPAQERPRRREEQRHARGGRAADRDRPHELPRRVGRHPRRAELLGHHHRLTDTVGVP